MKDETVDVIGRRDFLTITSAAVGACWIGVSAIPFIRAMTPTKDIIAAFRPFFYPRTNRIVLDISDCCV